MNKTVLITGSSSGIGKATAKIFQENNWNVIASMRIPEKETELTELNNVICPRLDVTKLDTIYDSIEKGVEQFSKIDVLVNNAGYALIGPFEQFNTQQIKRQFDTNVFGLMDVTKAILPHFRQHEAGIIINVSSMGGRLAFPLYSLYHATKWAVEGFSESLQFELEQFNITVKIIEPGAVKTDFYGRSADEDLAEDTPYEEFVNRAYPYLKESGEKGIEPEKVAREIYKAATDNHQLLRYPVGRQASFLLWLRKLLSDKFFNWIEKKIILK